MERRIIGIEVIKGNVNEYLNDSPKQVLQAAWFESRESKASCNLLNMKKEERTSFRVIIQHKL